MQTVIIVIHLMVIVALIAVVLMQRSEGGALGIGGAGNFLSTRGQANILTRATAILAAAFFVTSISLTLIAKYTPSESSILDKVPGAAGTTSTAPGGTGQGILDEFQKMKKTPGAPSASGAAPATAPDGTSGAATPAASGGTAGAAAPAADSGAATPAPATPATPSTPQVPTSQ